MFFLGLFNALRVGGVMTRERREAMETSADDLLEMQNGRKNWGTYRLMRCEAAAKPEKTPYSL